MPDNSLTSNRKADHIRINLEEDVQSSITTGLEKYLFVHQALPEVDLDQIDTIQTIFNRKVKVPILISSMTGGTPNAAHINQVLAQAAQHCGAAMGVGSQRAAIEKSELAASYQVRKFAPDILLMANLGAVQLNYGYTSDHCKRAVDMIEADALILHLNALQEAVQPEGDSRFSGLVRKIEQVCHDLSVPVVAKEVGWGISRRSAKLLIEAGVRAIDVAGAGGTSWSQVERYRIQDESRARVAAAFRSWGIPTSASVQFVREVSKDIYLIASGGLKDGVDIAKCIALGADLGGMAGYFLKAAAKSMEDCLSAMNEIRNEIIIAMFAVGAKDIAELKKAELIKIN